METNLTWKVIESYFTAYPHALVRHHLDSYNEFFEHGIYQIFREQNPFALSTEWDDSFKNWKHSCSMYFGGRDGTRLYFGKPILHDENHTHYLFPNEARLRNMTYAMTIHYDVVIEFIDILNEGDPLPPALLPKVEIPYPIFEELDPKEGGETTTTPTTSTSLKITNISGNRRRVIRETVLSKIYLGKFPIMLQSNMCILSEMSSEMRGHLGECRNDPGGYFILDGKEKTIVCRETRADNMLFIRKYYQVKVDDDDIEEDEPDCSPIDLPYTFSVEINSVSENSSKSKQSLCIKILRSMGQMVVELPHVRQPVPLFLVFRALGIISDQEIIELCLLDLKKYDFLLEWFRPSVHDAQQIYTQKDALLYIASLTPNPTIVYAHEILSTFFLPHVGDLYIEKSYYLGYMVFRLLCVASQLESPTDCDNFLYKRVETTGSLLHDLFNKYMTQQKERLRVEFEKHKQHPQPLDRLVNDNYKEILSQERSIEIGIRDELKQTTQDLNRLSFLSMISHLRQITTSGRELHTSEWGFLDPLDTSSPDNKNEIDKHLSILTVVSGRGMSRRPILQWLKEHSTSFHDVCQTPAGMLANMTRVFINGYWAGSLGDKTIETVELLKQWRRNALIPCLVSIRMEYSTNTLWIYTDSGRLCRPLYHILSSSPTATSDLETKLQHQQQLTWNDLMGGFRKRRVNDLEPNRMYLPHELYGEEDVKSKKDLNLGGGGVIDIVDNNESEGCLIAERVENMTGNYSSSRYTHLEIHESLLLGVQGNLIVYPENNPYLRNLISCDLSKEACSMYHTGFLTRMDKTSWVLNSGQTPLVKSRYFDILCREENPYGENVIVAIMSYTGYNEENAILVNEGSIQRGLFRTTHYQVYEGYEERHKKTETRFANSKEIEGIGRPDEDASHLDSLGIVRDGTEITENTVVIGMVSYVSSEDESGERRTQKYNLSQTTAKKGCIVDRTFVTERGDEGERLAKVRIRQDYPPEIGDKLADRAGQKGVIGLIVRENDVPFTKNGMRPDLIINPNAFPSSETIGKLVEMIVAKVCTIYGGFGDCTAFESHGSKVGHFGTFLMQGEDRSEKSSSTVLSEQYHSSGCEIFYNGMTGEQIESEIFMGPSYYMCLTKDREQQVKIRNRGPCEVMTRQPVAGPEGGLKIGEEECNVLLSYGVNEFLRESFMERSDKYQIAICNTTGGMAVYNADCDIFLSPLADGPIQFNIADKEEIKVIQSSQIGRSFSLIDVPYSLKQFLLEIGTMGIQMRMVSEDSMSRCHSILLGDNTIQRLIHKNYDSVKDTPYVKSASLDFYRTLQQQQQQQIKKKKKPTKSSPDLPVIPTETFVVGQWVSWFNDISTPPRVWQIITVHEDDKYTIGSKPSETSTQNQIQVVSGWEIKPVMPPSNPMEMQWVPPPLLEGAITPTTTTVLQQQQQQQQTPSTVEITNIFIQPDDAQQQQAIAAATSTGTPPQPQPQQLPTISVIPLTTTTTTPTSTPPPSPSTGLQERGGNEFSSPQFLKGNLTVNKINTTTTS